MTTETHIELEIVDAIGKMIRVVQRDRGKIRKIKSFMSERYDITGGRVEQVLNDYTVLEEADIREVLLFAEQFFANTGLSVVDPHNWFTENEILEARQYTAYNDNIMSLPYTVDNVIPVNLNKNIFSATLDIRAIADMINSQILFYNLDVQREPSKEIRRGIVRERPKVNKRNVEEMKELILKDKLMVTSLTFNAVPHSSYTDEELIFHDEKLTIGDGTRLDILDGYHRCLASVAALEENPDVDFKFNVLFYNLTTKQAKQLQAQLAKATPIHKSRAEELAGDKMASHVIELLKVDSELSDKISTGNINKNSGEMVSYSTLSSAISNDFEIKNRLEAESVAEYLNDFFKYLFGLYSEKMEEFSLMKTDRMFLGYIALSSAMYSKNVNPKYINVYIDSVDFSRDNLMWKEMGLLDNNEKIARKTKNSEEKLINYFKEMVK